MKKRPSSQRKRGLDPVDCEMIALLQKDGRIPNTEIAKKLGISEATVRTRLNRLIAEEYIQIVAVSNPLKLGFDIVGIIRIQVDIKKIKRITVGTAQDQGPVVHRPGDRRLRHLHRVCGPFDR